MLDKEARSLSKTNAGLELEFRAVGMLIKMYRWTWT